MTGRAIVAQSGPPSVSRDEEDDVPIVFVHGVNTRQGPGYEAGRLATEAFLKRHLGGATIDGKQLPADPMILFPYWGGLATTFAWDMASLPKGGVEALGGTSDTATREMVGQVRDALADKAGNEPITALAKKDFVLSADAVVALALVGTRAGQEADTARFVVAIQTYATENPNPAWAATIATDSQFVNKLVSEAIGPGAHVALGAGPFGVIKNVVSAGAAKLKRAAADVAGSAIDKTGDFASAKLLGFSREPLNGILGRFFGDIFIYMSTRGDAANPGPIPQRVLADFAAAAQQAPAEPLVIIGHSLGGVITMDLLGSFRPDLTCDLFISVGSQVAHFEEIKLYLASDKSVRGPSKAHTPDNIRRWINVYDEVDIFSYACKEVFDEVDIDAPYDTQTYVVKAHSAYFDQDRFYKRLRARIDELE